MGVDEDDSRKARKGSSRAIPASMSGDLKRARRVRASRRSAHVPRDRSGRVKLTILWALYGRGWLTVQRLRCRADIRLDIETYLGRVRREKTLSIALMRYWREGLVERHRMGRSFRYRLTAKGGGQNVLPR